MEVKEKASKIATLESELQQLAEQHEHELER